MKWRMVGAILFAICLQSTSSYAAAKDPDCTHPDAWPSGMAFTHLKNSGVIQSGELDSAKTSVVRLASQKTGKNLYRQVHRVHFTKISGEVLIAITVNDVSTQECSMSGVDVYLVSKRLGDYRSDKSK